MTAGVFAADIDVGDHITRTWFGLTVNVDTVISTLVAAAVILILGFYLRHKLTAAVPGKLQLAFETIVNGVEDQVEGAMGDRGRQIVPLAFTLFVFILFANWIEMIPSGHNPEYLPSPSADINFTLALAALVIVLVHLTWIRRHGLRNYVAHYFKPFPAFFVFTFIEELVKPFTLALRLFGNIFAGSLLIVIFANAIPAKFIVPIPLLDIIWKAFDGIFIGPLQAFIFALLTILYFQAAIAGDH